MIEELETREDSDLGARVIINDISRPQYREKKLLPPVTKEFVGIVAGLCTVIEEQSV